MAHPYHHARSSVKKYGGRVEDYLDIHKWFDASKAFTAHFTHRALRHHAQGIFACEQHFGEVMTNSDGRVVPVRFIGEQHVKEDCAGIIPCMSDWFRRIRPEGWMAAGRLRDDDVPGMPLEAGTLSVEQWRTAVAAGSTMLGYAEWAAMRQARAEAAGRAAAA